MAVAVGPRAQLLTRGDAAPATPTPSLPRVAAAAVLDRIQAIGRVLERHPGLTTPELAERIGLARRNTSLLMLRLEEHGHVVHEGRRWFLGPDAAGDAIAAVPRFARDPAKSRNLR